MFYFTETGSENWVLGEESVQAKLGAHQVIQADAGLSWTPLLSPPHWSLGPRELCVSIGGPSLEKSILLVSCVIFTRVTIF